MFCDEPTKWEKSRCDPDFESCVFAEVSYIHAVLFVVVSHKSFGLDMLMVILTPVTKPCLMVRWEKV